MQCLIMTSDHQQSNTLPAFFHLWNKYFHGLDHQRVVCGFTPFKCDADFFSIGRQTNYPVSMWSDALIKVLDTVADDVFLLMLDDYYLVRPVDTKAVEMCRNYMRQFEYVIKMDLTTDRLFADGGGKYLYGYHTYNTLGYLDLIKSDPGSPYHMSLWGGIWRRDLLRRILVRGETAQQIELNGTYRLSQFGDEMLVLGTRQAPLRHINVIQRGEWSQDAMTGLPALAESDLRELRELGYVKTG